MMIINAFEDSELLSLGFFEGFNFVGNLYSYSHINLNSHFQKKVLCQNLKELNFQLYFFLFDGLQGTLFQPFLIFIEEIDVLNHFLTKKRKLE